MVRKLTLKALKIANLTWNTPRIDPDQHFSVDEFRRMINNSVTAREKTGDEEAQVQFLWLQRVLKHFESILDEPWFTSLWTL
jgi:hypothetical protein